MDLAGSSATDNKKKRINPRHIMMAIREDDELDTLLSGVTIAHGGVMPNIHEALLKKRTNPPKI